MAVLELHVWGSAFSLPSIDPQCLAAIAYLSYLSQRKESSLDWVLVASNDASISPTKEIPLLLHESSKVGGLQNVIEYVRSLDSEWDLDCDFVSSPSACADLTAFTSHVLSRAAPLLDLSLYVSSENYTTTTRPTYSTILPWPTQYTIPPQQRRRAKDRTAHLGLSSLDLDDEDNDQQQKKSLIPESLRTAAGVGRRTVTSVLKSQQASTRFRLDALVDTFCQPLAELLSEKKYLLSDSQPSSLDCLAAAYLSLMLNASVPQSWLRDRIRTRWGGLKTYVDRMGEELWGTTGAERAQALPWSEDSPSSQTTVTTTARLLYAHTLSNLPYLRPSSTLVSASSPSTSPVTDTTISSHTLPTVLLTVTAAAAALAALASYLILPALSGPDDTSKRHFADMGEAGAMLSTMDFGPLGGGNVSQGTSQDAQGATVTMVEDEIDVDV